MNIYISGPMTGKPNFNVAAFTEAERQLREAGHEPLNPCVNDTDGSQTWAWYMRKNLKLLLDADAVATLDGWELSRGASLEVHVARQLTVPVYELYELAGTLPCKMEDA